jgi:fibrillarin-like pre-rRNA processing protein
MSSTGIPHVLSSPRGDGSGEVGLFTERGGELRPWDPRRSKLAAYILKGVEGLPFETGTHVLYLGAANGTTAGHVADICCDGLVYCVEFSKRSFRDLLTACEGVRHMVPILADARRPQEYSALVGQVDVVYQDIAQRDQADIFLRNLRAYFGPEAGKRPNGILMVKSRSIDVASPPKKVYARVRDELEGLVEIVDERALDPFEKDHMAMMVRYLGGR